MERKEFIRLVGRGAATALIMPCLVQCSEDDPKPNDDSDSNDSDDSTSDNDSDSDNNDSDNDSNDGSSDGVDFTLDITKDEWSDLQNVGGFVYSNEIIIARTKNDDFVAVAKNCTHQGAEIEYQADQELFQCPNHGSRFDTDGTVIRDPAQDPLKEYNTEFDSENNTVRVFESASA